MINAHNKDPATLPGDHPGLRAHFDAMVQHALSQLLGSEQLTAWFEAESSDFVRINGARIRQAGHAWQAHLTLQLINGRRHASQTLTLTGHATFDEARVGQAIETLRNIVAFVPDDPHLLVNESAESLVDLGPDALPTSADAVATLLAAAAETDLVGIWASGPVHAGFASSWGQRSYHARHAYHLDFSLHAGGDKAVKADDAGFTFDPDRLQAKVRATKDRLEQMRRPPKSVPPGAYRAWLSPAAVGEVVGLLGWDSFGLKSQRTRQSALQRVVDGVAALSPLVHIAESPGEGVAPRFGRAGFHRPSSVPLITAGRHSGSLVSPRSAQEYGVSTTGGAESPDSLVMQGGDLADDAVLAELGTGIFVGNLWYTNWSDRPAGRLTGMTRFATFWVEDGEIVAPLSVMRFDDSLERMLGSQLEAIGQSAPLQLSGDTYERRSTSSVKLPGALLSEFTFTL